MNKLEKHAVRRILFLSSVMDKKRTEISDDAYQSVTRSVNINSLQEANIMFNHAHQEIQEIISCLTEDDNLPF